MPGIGSSPDKMLQARLMSYADTHLHRLGVNHQQIPVNKPRCPVMHYERDGQGVIDNFGSAPNYWPNSVTNTPKPNAVFADPAWNLGQATVDRFDSTLDHDDYTQAGNLYRMFDDGERDRVTSRMAGGLRQAREAIQHLMLCHFFRTDPDFGRRMADKLKVDVTQIQHDVMGTRDSEPVLAK